MKTLFLYSGMNSSIVVIGDKKPHIWYQAGHFKEEGAHASVPREMLYGVRLPVHGTDEVLRMELNYVNDNVGGEGAK